MKNETWNNIPGFDPVKEQYVQLDQEQWLKDHRIRDHGEDQGKKNQPATEDDSLDEFESEIVDWVNRRGRVCRDNVSRHLSDLERELADMENDAELAILGDQVEETRQDAATALEAGVAAGRDRLTEEESAVRDGSAELERFKRSAGLTRLVDYSHRGTALRYIFICFAIEIVLNASLLMDVNPFGLLGATMQMALISGVNVIFAGLVMGVLLRQGHHVQAWRKLLAWLGIVGLVGAVLVFNLAVGHFRNSMQASLDDPSTDVLTLGNDVLQRLADGPFDLASFQTALLVLLGIVCFGVGAWKWFQRDDAYPGYGQQARQLEGKQDAYAKAYQREQDELSGIHERYRSVPQDIRHKVVVKQGKWREICLRGERLVTDFPVNLGQYQLDLKFLLAAYRTANRSARTQPPPRHFDNEEQVDRAILEPPQFRPPPETSLAGVAEKVNAAITGLQDEYRAARRRYTTLTDAIAQGVEEARADRHAFQKPGDERCIGQTPQDA